MNAEAHDHFVQLYQDPGFLAEAVADYVRAALARGEAVVMVARPGLRARFVEDDQLRLLDAEETLSRFMVNGTPSWTRFREALGAVIAELRARYPAVRIYGEMVDILWQAGNRDAAIRLEEYWNDLGRLETFSLFCAYRLDHRDPGLYGGPLEAICRVHSHLIASRESRDLDAEVSEASRKLLEEPLADLVLSLAANHRAGARMGTGQATLLWLMQNMPRTADKILSALRETPSPAA